MKARIFIMTVALAAGSIGSVNAQISNVLSSIKSTAEEILSGTSSNSIEGTWVYSGADVEFSSDNLLAQAGGKIASSKVESEINSLLNKYGISPNKLSLTFSKDGKYTGSYSSHTTEGSYTYADGNLTFKPSNFSDKSITASASAGNTLQITCDADKMLTLAQALGNAAEKATNNSTLSLINKLAKNYTGMKVGLKFKKK